jgi:hypothetical protein
MTECELLLAAHLSFYQPLKARVAQITSHRQADLATSSHRLTCDERQTAGNALPAMVSRESHADFAVNPRRDPLPDLTADDGVRVSALIPKRYKRAWRPTRSHSIAVPRR